VYDRGSSLKLFFTTVSLCFASTLWMKNAVTAATSPSRLHVYWTLYTVTPKNARSPVCHIIWRHGAVREDKASVSTLGDISPPPISLIIQQAFDNSPPGDAWCSCPATSLTAAWLTVESSSLCLYASHTAKVTFETTRKNYTKACHIWHAKLNLVKGCRTSCYCP